MCHVLGECDMESVLHVDFEAYAIAPVCFSVFALFPPAQEAQDL